MGMSLQEYWEGDIYLTRLYQKLEEIKLEKDNRRLWLQGLYTHIAVASAVGKAMWDGKGQKPKDYLEEPIPITEREKEAAKQRRIQKTLEWVRKGQE